MIAVTTAALLAGCGGGGKAKLTTLPTTSTATSASPTPPASAAIAQIRQNWSQFFDGSTSASDRIRLLENGDKFKKVVDSLGGSSLAKQVKARVKRVKLTGPTTASVTYTILLGGNPVLANLRGRAVLVDGVWKVGEASVCGLAKLEGVAPAACSAK